METIRYSTATGLGYPHDLEYADLPSDLEVITTEEYLQILKSRAEEVTPSSEAEKWDQIKKNRDILINDVMWEYQRHDRETRLELPHKRTDEWMHNLDVYVQSLADIPQNFTSPDDVVWPEPPEN